VLSNNRRYFMKLRRTALAGAAVVVATVGCLVGLMAATALAADTTTTTGVGAAAAISIADIVANPVRDQVVSISGTIDQVIEGNEYVLKDDTGTIKIDGGPAWSKLLGFTVGQEVTITGEVDLGKDGTAAAEIDIFTVEADGQTTTVREADGPPPWAGGPHKNGQTPGADAPDDATDSD
jgi:uncharacterized protein YdeI (BOF family)